MPLKRIVRPDGTSGWIRKAYAPKDYAVPKPELERLRSCSQGGRGSQDELDLHDGAFSAYTFVRRFEREGKNFVVLRNPREWAIEVELTRGQRGESTPLPPADAWRLAREADTRDPSRPIGFEGEPPP